MKKSTEKDPLTHAIIGVAMEVHNIMGPGHLEAVYHECLEIESNSRKQVGLLINFGEASLVFRRFVN